VESQDKLKDFSCGSDPTHHAVAFPTRGTRRSRILHIDTGLEESIPLGVPANVSLQLRIEGMRAGPVHSCGWSEERRVEPTALSPNAALC